MVKAGYKQTEIGLIPKDWAVKSLGDLFNLKSGFSFKSEYFSSSGPIVLTPGNFRLDGGLYFNERNVKRYSGLFPNSMIFENGDLLIVMTDLTPDCNLLGKPAFVESDETILHNQRIGKVQLISKIDKRFLYFTLLSDAYLKRIKEQATGSTVRHTSNKSIYSVLVPVPGQVEEQQAIAEAMSDVDALIAGLDKLIAKKRDVKTATMQQLLTGKKRLPGFGNGRGYKQTEIGEIPDDWDLPEVRQVMQLSRGGSPRPIQAYLTQKEDGVNWIKIGDVGIGAKYIDNTHEKITKEGEAYSRTVLPGDLLLSNSMSFGRPYITRIPGCIHDGWLVLQNYDEHFEIEFLYYLLSSNQILNQYKQKASGSSVLNLNKELVSTVLLPTPSLQEQKAIAKVCSDMDAEIIALETRRAKTQAIKQGMMQELLTGRTRLL